MVAPNQTPQPISRRSIAKGAAWAAPAMVVATTAPAVAASGQEEGPAPNDEANYYWAAAADAPFARLDPAQSDLRFQFSAQISYDATPWANPPADGALQITVRFTQPVNLESVGSAWKATPNVGQTATEFVFVMTPSANGGGFTGSFLGTEAGEINAEAYMTILNPGDATWAEEPGEDSGLLVT